MCELNLNIFNLLIVASIFIGTTFGTLLIFTKRINKKANLLLGLIVFIIVLWNIWVISLDFQFTRYFTYFYLIPLHYSLALGPLVYFYVKRITNFSFHFSKKELLHFLPVVIELSVHFLISIEAFTDQKTSIETAIFHQIIPIIQFLAIISVVSYSIFALKEIRIYHNWLNENYSDNDAYNLKWLYRLIVIFAIIWILWFPYTFIDYLVFNFQLGISDYYPIYIALSIITIWISAEAFLRPEIVFLEANRKEVLHKKEDPTEEILEKASWLKEEMKKNRFYLNSELTLKSLADNLNMHPNMLSKVINDGLDKNFSDFINEYRVNAIIKKLESGNYDHITLLGLSFECGFNSKTTFNRVFKNIKGITPLQYKKSIENNSK